MDSSRERLRSSRRASPPGQAVPHRRAPIGGAWPPHRAETPRAAPAARPRSAPGGGHGRGSRLSPRGSQHAHFERDGDLRRSRSERQKPVTGQTMTSFLLAIGFLTFLPVPVSSEGLEGLGRAGKWFPTVGLGLGLALALAHYLMGRVFLPLLTAGLTVALWAALTGALHLDGLAHC